MTGFETGYTSPRFRKGERRFQAIAFGIQINMSKDRHGRRKLLQEFRQLILPRTGSVRRLRSKGSKGPGAIEYHVNTAWHIPDSEKGPRGHAEIGLFFFSDRGIKKQTGRNLPTRDYQNGTSLVLAGIENPFDWSEKKTNGKHQIPNKSQYSKTNDQNKVPC